MESKRLEFIGFSVLFGALAILTFFVFQPFLRVLVLGAVLAVLFHPLYKKFVGNFHISKSIAASILMVAALVFVIMPLLYLSVQIFGQAQNFFIFVQGDQGQFLISLQQNVNNFLQHSIPGFSFSIADSISKAVYSISNDLGGILSQTTEVVIETFLLLFAFFFFLRDGEEMLNLLLAVSPFNKEQNKMIVGSVEKTINSVIRGTLFVGLVRFVLLIGGFYLLGIPNAILWGTIGGIIGAVPGLGTLFVIIPAFLYLMLYGNLTLAIGMGLFGVLLIFFVDNLLSTYFFGKGLDVSPVFVLFAIFGGVMLFGPLGFIFGPIILSLFISVMDMYKILLLNKE